CRRVVLAAAKCRSATRAARQKCLLAAQLTSQLIAAAQSDAQLLARDSARLHLSLQAGEIVALLTRHEPDVRLLELRESLFGLAQAPFVLGNLPTKKLLRFFRTFTLAAEGIFDERVQQLRHYFKRLVAARIFVGEREYDVARVATAGSRIDLNLLAQSLDQSGMLLRSVCTHVQICLTRYAGQRGRAE